MSAVSAPLIHLGGDVESVDNPGIVALQFKQTHPGAVSFQSQFFLLRFEVNQAASPGEIGESTPFGRNDRGVAIESTWTNNARMFVQGNGNVGFVG